MEAQLRDKRKRDTDEEADCTEAAPPAQKLCFNLEHEANGSDLLDELSGIGPVAQLAVDGSAEEAQSCYGSESESDSKSVPEASASDWTFQSEESSSSKCKKRVGGNRSQPKAPKIKRTPDSGRDAKEKPAKTTNTSEDSNGFSSFRRLPVLMFALLFTCWTQLGNAAEVMFGNAVGNIFFDFLASFMARFSQCVPQNNNRRVLSGAVLLGIFIFLVMISSTFSERITIPISSIHEFPRHSNSSFEALMTNTGGNRVAQVVGNHSPFSLSWVVDSGASCHICNDTSLFVNLKPCHVKISTAKSGESIVATGIGDIRFNTWSEQGQPVSIILQQGYLVGDARRNLLSVSCLAKQKFQTVLPCDNPVFAPGIYDCRQESRSELNRIPIECVDHLYFVKTSSNSSSLSDDNPWVVMQRRLGFMPMSAIRSLVPRSVGLETLADVPMPKNFIDENSMMGKTVNRDKPDSAQSRCSAPLEIVGWDIFGPCKSPSFGGHQYCAVFVDHFTRYCWVYMLKEKSEMPEIVKQFVADTALIRKDYPLRCLRRDNAGENVSQHLEGWLRDKGIRSEKSTPHEPWQNGKAENHIKVLCNIARTNMIASGLAGRYWARAITYAADVSNVQYRADLKMSPFEALHKQKPNLSHFQPFGVECWVYIRPEQRNDRKFDARGVPGIFVGRATSENKSASVIHIPSKGTTSRAFVVTNNVIFGHKYPLASVDRTQSSGGVIDSIPQSASAAELIPGNVSAVDKVLKTHLVVRLQDSSLRTVSHRQFYAYLIDAQDSQFTQQYLNLLDAHTLFEDLSGFEDFEIESDVCFSADFKQKLVDPKNHADAMARSDAAAWKEAEIKEVQGLINRGCFKIVDRPANCTPLPTTMVYKYKYSKDNNITVRKCRLCVRGDLQREGVDYFKYKTYSAVLNSRENRVLCALAASTGWSVHQTDITQAFTYGELDPGVEIYCFIPDGFPSVTSNKVLKLERSVYGLKQAPAAFKDKLTSFFKSKNFQAVNDSGTVWMLTEGSSVLITACYVDDVLHFTNDQKLYRKFRQSFEKTFDVKSSDTVDVYLGNEVIIDKSKRKVALSQSHYILSCLDRFGLSSCNGVDLPLRERLSSSSQPSTPVPENCTVYRAMVGSLLYVAQWTRPDISYSVSELSRFVSNPGNVHLEQAKRVFRYLSKTASLHLEYSPSAVPGSPVADNQLWGYVDSDWAGCPDTRRSTSGYVLMLNGAAVSWRCKRQSVFALSSAEAEFIAASSMVQEVIFLRKFLANLGFQQNGPTPIFADNETCIHWSEGSVGGSDRAKHIDLRKHFVHDARQQGILQLQKIDSEFNAADLLTKPFKDTLLFERHRKHLMGF